ncbi:helix-turn-helix domain-containing protein [Sinobaca sp. H24]
MLTSTTDNIENIAEKCGYNSMPHFYRTFKRKTSITPHEYRKNKRI